ncbi:tail fiber protein [Aeromonas phage pAEv1810]|uniref:tail fiber protein n=1 Tax=Aeromonas phage pAEv1810 TaxID=2908744 RepID=UPI0023293CDE|nr:tail fiber protein [Aeromonas phage pAEv1810]UIS25124.1 hypothetical protein pAEv1810_186 [Aeromonas phage pAEv1810]
MSSNKPFPSSDLDVFKDNSLILDNFVNSQDNEYPDRFGRKRPTITGIIKEAFNVRTDISNMNETLIGQSRWDTVPKNTSLTLGGDNGALNKQAQALFNRTEMLKVHSREALRRTYLEVGLNLVEGSFEEGGTLETLTDILIEDKTGKCYSWKGSLPKVINKGETPSENGWFLVSKLSPEHFGAGGEGSTDDTLALKRFIQAILDGVDCKFQRNKIYNVSSNLSFILSDKIYEIDFKDCVIRYITPIPEMTLVKVLNFTQPDHTKQTSLKVSNLKIISDIPYFESVTASDRRGIWGMTFTGIKDFTVENYKAENLFYGSGLTASKYNKGYIRNINFVNVGSKFNPTKDDVSASDAAGDGFHFYDVIGDASTVMENVTTSSYTDKIGRCGVALEAFGNLGTSHNVSIKNGNFFGYHRVVHQEDGGISVISWEGGEVRDFSNLFVSVQGTVGNLRGVFNNLKITVNQKIAYGGVSGLVNFQQGGRLVLNECFIKYLSSVQQKGPLTINNSVLDLGSKTIFHASLNEIIYNNCNLIADNGKFDTSGQPKGFVFNNCFGKKFVIVSQNPIVKISHCEFEDVNFKLTNTGTRNSEIRDTSIHYSLGTTILENSYNCGIDFLNTNITSIGISVIYGDGNVDSNVKSCTLKNVKLQISNGNADPEGRDVVQITGTKFIATESSFGTSFFNKYQAAGVVQSCIFIDKTTEQTLVKETDGPVFLVTGRGNVLINKAGGQSI